MAKCNKKSALKRAQKVRYKLKLRSDGRLRLSVFKSSSNIYAQVIDDSKGVTVAAASTLGKQSDTKKNKCNIQFAKQVGLEVAEKMLRENITKVVFDRGSYPYHGKIKALADAARSGGLEF